MEYKIFLYGSKKKVFGWLELFEQEKIPFKYNGVEFKKFGLINILVGYKNPQKLISKANYTESIFIIEKDSIKSPVYKKNKIVNIPSKYSYSIPVNHNLSERNRALNTLREILIRILNNLDLPYIHLWYYPDLSKKILLFRQDVDYVDTAGCRKLKEITTNYKIRGTYFVNISGEEEFDEEIGHLQLSRPTTPKRKKVLVQLEKSGNEIANHGYWHWVYGDYKNNLRNIRSGKYYLKKIFKYYPAGYASPGAVWNKYLAKALEKIKLLYSCNGLVDGGFPFFPYIEGKKSTVLEIPFPFFCDASFEPSIKQHLKKAPTEHKHVWLLSDKQVNKLKSYYLKCIDNYQLNPEPIAVFGHPHITGRQAGKIYPQIFKKINKINIKNLTLNEFASWWKKREKLNITCKFKDNKLIIKSSQANVSLEVSHRGKRRLIKTNNTGYLTLDLWTCYHT